MLSPPPLQVILAMIWGIVAALVCILLPIWEARDVWAAVLTGKSFADVQTKTDASGKDGVAATQA